jgi:3-methyladenine DNA glycosylase AlkD
MTEQEALAALEALGSEQTRKTYRRHGVGANLYGVSYAELGKLKKRIKVDHALAQRLWASGNHDARVLATMIADTAQLDDTQLDQWAADLDSYPIADAFAGLAAKAPGARAKAEAWMDSDNEWLGRAGWLMLANLAMYEPTLPDTYFEPYLPLIEREIHGRKNRVRDAMNSALIAIGLRYGEEGNPAIAAAERIGKVEVDHGDTYCKTPSAAPYSRKGIARRHR